MFRALLVMSHDGPFKTQYMVWGVSEIAKDSLAQRREQVAVPMV